MNIDELKAKAEDVQEVKEPELTEEQKQQYEKFMRSAIVRKYKLALRNLYQVMSKRQCTIADVKELINNKTKTLPFTASQRQFVIGFKDEFLVACLKDLFNEKELYAVNLTISEPVQTGTGSTRDVQSNS